MFLVKGSTDLGPQRLTKRRAREMLKSLQSADDLVTAPVEGTDLVIRTLEWLGHPEALGVPADPVAANRRRPVRRPAAPAPAEPGE